MTYATTSFDVGLELPPEWYTVNPATDDLSGTLGRVVDERVASEPDLASIRAQLVDSLVEFGIDARSKNALLAAALIDPGQDSFSVAHLFVFLTRHGDPTDLNGGSSRPGEAEMLDEIATRLQQARDGDIGPRYVKVVELRDGRAVSVRFMAETDRDEKNRALALECVQYWIPVAGTNEVVIASFTTPMVARADEFAASFHDVARTISIQTGQETKEIP